MRKTAKYPHANNTCLGGPVTLLANGDPPKPLAPGTRFTSLLLFAEHSFVDRDGQTIQLYRMTPLYTEERELAAKQGVAALTRAFDRHNVPFVVDLQRLNVTK